MTLLHLPTTDLRPHPSLAHVFSLADEDPRFLELVHSVRESGILHPLLVTEDGQIADGRHRWRAARKLKLETVPCLRVPDERVTECALETARARRNWVTKGQYVYAMYPTFARRHRELVAHHRDRMQPGERGFPTSPVKLEDWVLTLGIGPDLFRQAAELHKRFEADKALRDEWEPKIMAGEDPVGLGYALNGLAGRAATAGKQRGPTRNTPLHRWVNSWGVFAKESKWWDKWDAEQRECALDRMRHTIEVLPDPVLDAITTTLRHVRRSRGERPSDS